MIAIFKFATTLLFTGHWSLIYKGVAHVPEGTPGDKIKLYKGEHTVCPYWSLDTDH